MRTATALMGNTRRDVRIARDTFLRRVETRAQIGEEPERHRYCSRYMELFVWLSCGVFVGFELDFRLRTTEERSLRWSVTEGLVFSRVQAADDDNGDRRQCLEPIADSEPPLQFITAVFASASRHIDHHTRRYVLETLIRAYLGFA